MQHYLDNQKYLYPTIKTGDGRIADGQLSITPKIKNLNTCDELMGDTGIPIIRQSVVFHELQEIYFRTNVT